MMLCHSPRRSRYGILCAAILAVSSASFSVASERFIYHFSLTSPEQHLVQVQIVLPPGAASARTPASRLERSLPGPRFRPIRELGSRQRSSPETCASDPGSSTTAAGRLEGAGDGAIVEYQIYVDSFGPFGAQLNSHHAFLNLAQILMYPGRRSIAPLHDPLQPHAQPTGTLPRPCRSVLDRRLRTPKTTTVSSTLPSRSEAFQRIRLRRGGWPLPR